MAGAVYAGCRSVVYFLAVVHFCQSALVKNPIFNSINLVNETLSVDLNNVLSIESVLSVSGINLHSKMKVRVTTDNSSCSKQTMFDDENLNVSVIWSNSTNSFISAKVRLNNSVNDLSDSKFYMCVKSVHRTRDNSENTRSDSGLSTFEWSSDVQNWIHQGESAVFRTKKKHFLNERSADLSDHSSRSVNTVVPISLSILSLVLRFNKSQWLKQISQGLSYQRKSIK